MTPYILIDLMSVKLSVITQHYFETAQIDESRATLCTLDKGTEKLMVSTKMVS